MVWVASPRRWARTARSRAIAAGRLAPGWPPARPTAGRLLGGLGQGPLGVVQGRPGRLQVAVGHGHEGPGQAEPGPGADQLGRQPGQPPRQGGALPGDQEGVDVLLDQPGRPDRVAGGQGVADGLVDHPVGLCPGGRGPVQLRHPFGLLLLEAGPQQVGEQVVVAPPAADLVQGDQEQVAPLQLLQQPLAVGPAGDGVAQRSREPLQHRGLEQEPHRRLGLAVQDLLGQVVEHVAVAAGEAGHEAAGVVAVVQRQGGQLEPGRPALGPGHQGAHAGLGQVGVGDLPQQGGRLLGPEPQGGGAQLGQLPAGPERGQGQRRVGPAGQDQPQLVGQPVQQQPQAVVDRRGLDPVVVVQDQGELAGLAGQGVDQDGDHGLERRRPGAAPEQGRHPLAGPGLGLVKGGGHVPPEAGGVVVALVERQPGHRPPAAPGPFAEQGRLAEPGRGAYQGQLPAGPVAEQLQQPRAGQEAGPGAGDVQLGRE